MPFASNRSLSNQQQASAFFLFFHVNSWSKVQNYKALMKYVLGRADTINCTSTKTITKQEKFLPEKISFFSKQWSSGFQLSSLKSLNVQQSLYCSDAHDGSIKIFRDTSLEVD